MHRVKDIYGENDLYLPDLCYGDKVLYAHRVPITEKGLEKEIQITKAIRDKLNGSEWTKII